jgi:uncharacterized protein YutE (UPF0331/DUF86 family)
LSVIAESVSALRELQGLTYDEFVGDHRLVSSVERDFQVAIQAALDIGALLLAEALVKAPTGYGEIFPRLAEIGVLPPDFARKLVGMARFRNVLVHMYLRVDPTKVYHALQHDLGDFALFAGYVGEYLARKES